MGAGHPVGIWTVNGRRAGAECCRELSAVQRDKAREGPESDEGRLLAQPPPRGARHLSQMATASKILHRVTQMPPGVPSGCLDLTCSQPTRVSTLP